MRSLVKDTKLVTAAEYASGTATTKCPATGIDTNGFDSACFILALAAIATGAATSFKIQESDTAVDDAGFTDITGATAATIADDDDGQNRRVEVKPTKRYVRALLTKDAANAVGATVLCQLFNADEVPVTQPAGTEDTFVA